MTQRTNNYLQKKERNNSHLFLMSPLKHAINNVYYKNSVEVNFHPTIVQAQDQTNSVYQSFNIQKDNNKICQNKRKNNNNNCKESSILPMFNQDYKYYTSCFIIPYQSEDSDNDVLLNHNMKLKQSLSEIPLQDILIPKPRSKSLYCAVCKNHYEDYLDHISCSHHKKSIKKSEFNQEIQKLYLLVNKDSQP